MTWPTAVDRRRFLALMGRGAGGACLACLTGALLPEHARGEPTEPRREVDFYTPLPGGRIRCNICPRHCELDEGETGFCRARMNVGGRHYCRGYAEPCILSVDPIEKLPLNHFRPGSQALTIAIGGCNMRCLYCQNWQHSQKSPDELKTFALPAEEAVASARKKKIDTIAFSYTEPVAFLEYAKDVAAAARKARLRVVVATSGYVEPEPLLAFAEHVDAFALTLKGFDDEFYKDVIGARLEPVLRTAELIKSKTKCWLEIVNLVVPTYNDDAERIGKMAQWIYEHLGRDVPLNFERFVPVYRLGNLPRTPVQTLEAACQAARAAGLQYVYTSNIAPHEATNTFCANCGARVIDRLGFKILEHKLRRGACPNCKQRLPGVWK